MKQSEKYTKSGQTGSEGGILREGDITNDETQTGEGSSAASSVTSLRAGGSLFHKKPRPGSLFPLHCHPVSSQRPPPRRRHLWATKKKTKQQQQAAQYLRKRLFLSLAARNINLPRSNTEMLNPRSRSPAGKAKPDPEKLHGPGRWRHGLLPHNRVAERGTFPPGKARNA